MLYMNGLCSAGRVGAACVEWRRRTCNAAATQGLTPSWLHSREFNDSGCLQLELGLNRAKHAKLMLLYPNPILPIDW